MPNFVSFRVFLRSDHSIHGYQSRCYGVTEHILVLNIKYFVLFAYILKNTIIKYKLQLWPWPLAKKLESCPAAVAARRFSGRSPLVKLLLPIDFFLPAPYDFVEKNVIPNFIFHKLFSYHKIVNINFFSLKNKFLF